MEKYNTAQPIVFKKGLYDLNDNDNLNYELNRLVNWDGGDLEELSSVSKSIKTFADWKRVLLELGEKAEKEERWENAIGYYRMAEFYIPHDDPDALKTYNHARELFYEYYGDYFEGENPVVVKDSVPYEDTEMPVMIVKADGEKKGTFVVHGGYDSYYEEFLFPMLYLKQHGYDVYLFEGPGQGEMLRLKNKPLIPEWEKPVKALLDKYNLKDVTIIGISLGGYLAPRAAAYDKRIQRVVSWGVFHSLIENMNVTAGKAASGAFNLLALPKVQDKMLEMTKKKAAEGNLKAGVLVDALHKIGASSFSEGMKWVKACSISHIASLIDQDILVMGMDHDVLCSHLQVSREIKEMKNVKSFTFRLFTNKEEAGDHCSCGNTKLVLDEILSWMASLDARDCE